MMKRRSRRRALCGVWWILALTCLSSCGRRRSSGREEITVLCGGSFRPPMEKLAGLFEERTGITATLSFGQCEDHLPHVRMHAEGDVFVAHDPYMKYVKDAGAMLRYVVVGHVAPVLVVKKGNPHEIKSVDDLARRGLRVCLPDPEFSTCGEMVFKLLEKKGIRDAVMKNAGNALFRSHAQSGSAIKLGHRDAGVMWNGVAHNWLDALEVVPARYEYGDEIRVAVIGLSYSKKKALVERFLEFSEIQGPRVFGEHGYVK